MIDVRYHYGSGTAKSDFFEEHTEGKLEKIKRLPFNARKVDVASFKEGAFYTVDICIQGKKEVRASASTPDLMESLDRVMDKATSQITKLKLTYHDSRRAKRKSKRKTKDEILNHNGFIGDMLKDKVA